MFAFALAVTECQEQPTRRVIANSYSILTTQNTILVKQSKTKMCSIADAFYSGMVIRAALLKNVYELRPHSVALLTV